MEHDLAMRRYELGPRRIALRSLARVVETRECGRQTWRMQGFARRRNLRRRVLLAYASSRRRARNCLDNLCMKKHQQEIRGRFRALRVHPRETAARWWRPGSLYG